MIKRFQVYLVDENFKLQTHRLGKHTDIIIDWDEDFTYEELLSIHERAFKINKGKYGFDVYFKDGGAIKRIHTRGTGDHANTTIKKKDTPESHLKRIYGIEKDDEQLELF